MALSSPHIWTSRFRFLMGLILVGEIILSIAVYLLFRHSYPRTALALTACFLLAGIGILAILWEPTPRQVLLSAGFFLLLALFGFMVMSGLQQGINPRQPVALLPLALMTIILVLTLLAFLGKTVTRHAGASDDLFSRPVWWFTRLGHVALFGIAVIVLLVQMAIGNQLLLLPFTSQIYPGFSLNEGVVLLLAVIALVLLLRLNVPMTIFDGCIILILALVCSLLQYTFGSREHVGMNAAWSAGINLLLTVAPLVLAIFALFSEWGRFFTPLWLTVQLLILQPFLPLSSTPLAADNALQQSIILRQSVWSILVVALLLLLFRLVWYADQRQTNVVDVLTTTVIVLISSLTLWSLGQNDLRQSAALLNTQPGVNQRSLAYSLIVIASLAGIILVLIAALFIARRLLRGHFPWLERLQNVGSILLVLATAIGALFLLNSMGGQNTYLTATTLNLHTVSASLPTLSVRNQYVLDGLFALLFLLYVPTLATQRWNRSFSHIERLLLILSGGGCLLFLANPGRQSVLPLVTSNLQQVGAHMLSVFTADHVATLGILLASLISLLWLRHSSNTIHRLVLLALFGMAALCSPIHFFFASPLSLLVALLLLMAGTLIAARMVLVQTDRSTRLIGAQATLLTPTEPQNDEPQPAS